MKYLFYLLILAAIVSAADVNVPASESSDDNADNQSCPKDGCPDKISDTLDDPSVNLSETQSPSHDNPAEDKEPTVSSKDLAEVQDPAWWDLLSQAKTELTRLTGTLYDTLNTVASTFADTVRRIMNEELYDILAVMFGKVGRVMLKPGETLFDLFNATLSVILLLICFICSYIFMNVFSFTFVVAFLCAVFLLHYFLGAMTIFKGTYLAGKHILSFSWIMAKHPTISSAVVLTLIVVTATYSVMRAVQDRLARREEARNRQELYRGVRELRRRVIALEQNQQEALGILREFRPHARPAAVDHGVQTDNQ